MNHETIGELIKSDITKYQEYVNKGGEPAKITLELKPSGDGLTFEIRGQIPDEVKKLPVIIQFVLVIKEQIIASIQPEAAIAAEKKKAGDA